MSARGPLAAVFLLMSLGCQAPPEAEPEFTDADRQAIVDEINRLTAEVNALGEPEQFEEFMAYWAQGAENLFLGEPALWVQGVGIVPTFDALASWAEGFVGARQSTNFFIQDGHVAVLSPTAAMHVGRYHWNITGNDGGIGPTYPLASTTVWVKEDGAWKIAHYHQSWTFDTIQ